jgi:hypothetical protein
MLAIYAEARRQVARALDELVATQQSDGARNEIPASKDVYPLDRSQCTSLTAAGAGGFAHRLTTEYTINARIGTPRQPGRWSL